MDVGKKQSGDPVKKFTFNGNPYKFYGLVGTEAGKPTSVSVIRFDSACLAAFKEE